MKKFITFFLAASLGQAWAFKTPDILVDSKLDYNWSSFLVSKFRQLAQNYGQSDPFKARFAAPITITETSVGPFLSPESRELMTDLGSAVGLGLVNTQTKVQVHGFAYDLQDFKTDLKASREVHDGLVLSTDFSASSLSLSADKVTLSLVIPTRSGTDTPVLNIQVIRPVIHANQERLINFFAQMKIQDMGNAYKLQLQRTDFGRMADNMVLHPEDIDLDYERVIVPEVSIRIGNKQINFSSDRIERVLRERHEALKGLLLAQVASSLKSGTTDSLNAVVNNFKVDKEYWIGSSLIKSQLEISDFTNSLASNHIEVQSAADFCTIEAHNRMGKECVRNRITETADSRLGQNHYRKSLHTMKDLMERGEANLVASISEDYLNKLLVTTYDAGLWEEALDEASVQLGPNKVVMRLDKRGDSGTLIMDVVYKASTFQGILLGKKTIRFPLALDVSVRIEKHDNEPVVIVRLNDVDLSEETLVHGKPEHNMISTIQDVPRFKGKVVNTIREKLRSLRAKDILELRYPEFRGLGLESVDFLSDGNGRMNAMMRLEDLVEEASAHQ